MDSIVVSTYELSREWKSTKVLGLLLLQQLDSLDGLAKVTTEKQRDKFQEELTVVSRTFKCPQCFGRIQQ